MSIDKINVIDAIGADKRSGKIVLTIADDQDWKDDYNHLFQLQEKINTYLGTIEGGEIYNIYPKSIGMMFVISIYFKFDPSPTAIEFLEKVTGIIEKSGFQLKWKVVN